ncbi:MAG TPA: DotU family type IV/VI secretion system protein [Luteimonas sp.]|nr:DotU family type IV/VI secretion system protein [Luteimonas sp.]
MARLLHHFMPLFSFGLALDEKVAANAASEPAARVVDAARTLLERAKAAAAADGKRPEHVEDATFAVVAWIDEIMARHPAYLTSATPLQVTLYTTNNAGNEFFQHLGALRDGQDEVREVYYHALLLGFVGQYYYENGDTGELGRLKELHARQLPVAPAPLHTLREEKITPQPYSGDMPAGPRYPRQWDHLLLKAGIAVALAIPLGYLGWALLAAPAPVEPDLRALVDAQLTGFPCSDLRASVDADDRVRVDGHVSRPDDIAALRQRVTAVEGAADAKVDVALRIWPHCEVVALLKPHAARNRDGNHGLAVAPVAGHSDRFIENERVIVDLVQADYDGYLYVDYYTVGGDVAHLYPNPHEPGSGRQLRARERLQVGATDARTWTIGAPFGQELITVIASPVPLYEGAPPSEIEAAKDYLPRLRQLVEARQGDGQVTAEFLFMQTEPAR